MGWPSSLATHQQSTQTSLQVAREVQALKAQWAAEDEAAHQGEVEARLGQQRLNAEVKEFNRWAQSHYLQHHASPCGQVHSGVSLHVRTAY